MAAESIVQGREYRLQSIAPYSASSWVFKRLLEHKFHRPSAARPPAP
jgi:hypothetical protein